MKHRIALYADEGMVLTDGDTFCKVVYLSVGADASLWHEIPESDIPQEEEI